MPCKKMSKDVSIPTFTIQYLMESGQGLTSNVLCHLWHYALSGFIGILTSEIVNSENAEERKREK